MAKSIGASVSLLVLLMNIEDWFPSGLTGWISLQSKELSRVQGDFIRWFPHAVQNHGPSMCCFDIWWIEEGRGGEVYHPNNKFPSHSTPQISSLSQITLLISYWTNYSSHLPPGSRLHFLASSHGYANQPITSSNGKQRVRHPLDTPKLTPAVPACSVCHWI